VRWAILDTSIYIGHWEQGAFEHPLEAIRRTFIIRHSAVVLSELRRGARTSEARRIVEALFRLARVCWEPNPRDWWEAGRLIRTIGDAGGWGAAKRRDFQTDALIALTARRHGATVVTSKRRDFELLAREVGVGVLTL
jgi:predicted nucleic acid-binding protein